MARCPICGGSQLSEWPHDHGPASGGVLYEVVGGELVRVDGTRQPNPDPLHPDEDPRVPRHEPQPARSFLGCRWWVALAVTIAIAVLLIAAPDAAPNTQEGGGYLDGRSNPEPVLTTLPAVPSGASADRPVGAEGPSVGSNPTTGNDSGSMPAPTPTPEPTGAVGDGARGGYAVWHDNPRQPAGARYAAAGPGIREWLGSDWRGQVVRVTYAGRSTLVPLSDWCACGDRAGLPTLIDLSTEAWLDLAPLSAGVIEVDIVLVGLPPTEVVE